MSKKFFKHYQEEIDLIIDRAYEDKKTKYQITQIEFKYFLALFKLIHEVNDYLKKKRIIKKDLDIKIKFGYTLQDFLNFLKNKKIQANVDNDPSLQKIFKKFNDDYISGSVINKEYKDFRLVQRAGERPKPKRNERQFPFYLPKIIQPSSIHKERIRKILKELRALRKAEYYHKVGLVRRSPTPVVQALDIAQNFDLEFNDNNLMETMASPRTFCDESTQDCENDNEVERFFTKQKTLECIDFSSQDNNPNILLSNEFDLST